MKRSHKVDDMLTTNRQLRATCDELEVASASGFVVFGHDVEQVVNCATLDIEAVVGLDSLVQCWKNMLTTYMRMTKTIRTLYAPIFIRVTEQHDQLICSEGLKVCDWENFGEPFAECLSLKSSAFSDDRVDDFIDVLLDVLGGNGNIATIRLESHEYIV